MSIKKPDSNSCGCCEGLKELTPIKIENQPSLPSLQYRAGTYGTFLSSMKSRLSQDAVLSRLTNRNESDPSFAIMDAWAMALDVLTFYQERIAEEGYLRTAKERISIIELSRSIGYRLKPGVAASTQLAFELESAPGSPSSVQIDIGTRAQSIPGQDEVPQTFETIEKIEARPEWNHLELKKTAPQSIKLNLNELYLKGTNTQLQPGDAITIVGTKRETEDKSSEAWDMRIVQTVEPNPEKNQTIITWDEGLGKPSKSGRSGSLPAEKGPRIFAMRQRASLFGYNAPDFKSMPESYNGEGTSGVWKDFKIQTVDESMIDLDRVYPKVLAGSWIVLASSNQVELYKVLKIETVGRENFGLTGTVSRLTLDTNEHLDRFKLRDTVVHIQSEELYMDAVPLRDSVEIAAGFQVKVFQDKETLTPLWGDQILLDKLYMGLERGRAILVSGKRIRALVTNVGEIFQVLKAPVIDLSSGNAKIKWHLKGKDFEGFVLAGADSIVWKSAADDDEVVSEVVYIEKPPYEDENGNPTLKISQPLENTYDRSTVILFANLAHATNGESIEEVLGYGDASRPFQMFTLSRTPLTYVPSSEPRGRTSTLKILVNGIEWKEVPFLYGLGGCNQVFFTRIGEDGKTTVQFGDGITGSRLPTGAEIKAIYRIGIGLGGLVKANQISLLMTRPMGLKCVTNPGASSGAEDPEPEDQARKNAPSTVLNFGRVVSLRDYEDFALAFAGIAKARAEWIWDGEKRIVQLVVASADGRSEQSSLELRSNLREAILSSGNPYQPLRIDSYKPKRFALKAGILADSRFNGELVLGAVRESLKNAFSFQNMNIGQMIKDSDVIEVMQKVKGVLSVDLDSTTLPESIGSEELLIIDKKGIDIKEIKQ